MVASSLLCSHRAVWAAWLTSGSSLPLRGPTSRSVWHGWSYIPSTAQYSSSTALIALENATIYRHRISTETGEAAPIFEDVNFTLDAQTSQWAVISPNSVSRTAFLQVLAGQHIAKPASARRYPALSEQSISPTQAIKYVGFDADRGSRIGGTSLRGAYLSARYESRREETDFSVRDYLSGHTELNAIEKNVDQAALEEVVKALNLSALADMPVSNLSNGQTRRARIAKALMDRPQVLLLDGPFMGLDPRAALAVSRVLQTLAEASRPRLVISLKPQDPVPEYITNLLVLAENKIVAQGERTDVLASSAFDDYTSGSRPGSRERSSSEQVTSLGEPVVEMTGVKVSYGDKTVLGSWSHDGEQREGLWWSLHRGQRVGVFGPNGSGKTTMLSLITSDHPQTYGLPVRIFGRSRLPSPGQPGISVFDLQKKMGHSSPEVHAFFPRQLTVKRALQSAWADAPLAKPVIDAKAQSRVDVFLQTFAAELYDKSDQHTDWADTVRFGELSFASQRLLLFLRAIVSEPDLIILDEAFSGMDESTRDKAFAFLDGGHAAVEGDGTFSGLTPKQALLVVSHAKEDVPECVREWICLPDPGEGEAPRTGKLSSSLKKDPSGWQQIWNT